jgi:hypothetical protein
VSVPRERRPTPEWDDEDDARDRRLDGWLTVLGIAFALVVTGAAVATLWIWARLVQGPI